MATLTYLLLVLMAAMEVQVLVRGSYLSALKTKIKEREMSDYLMIMKKKKNKFFLHIIILFPNYYAINAVIYIKMCILKIFFCNITNIVILVFKFYR